MGDTEAAARPVLLLPGPDSCDAASHFFGEAYEYASYLSADYHNPAAATYLKPNKFKALAGRRVDVWQIPPRGRDEALIAGLVPLLRGLVKLNCQIRVIAPSTSDEQFEPFVCRAIELPKADLLAWARAHIKSVELPPDVPRETIKRGRPRSRGDGAPPSGDEIEGNTGSVFVSWERLGLSTNGNGIPYPNLSNVNKILTNHPQIVGKVWFDEFHGKVFQTLFQPEPAEWADTHDIRLAVWIQEQLRLPKIGHQTVQLAVNDYAQQHVRNEVREWMDGLEWDQRERLPTLFSDAFGTTQNDYTAAVGRCWMVSMAARVYQPGCKVDTMPVLEGDQGIRKSSALSIIGGKWFAEMHEDITTKDFLQNLPGKLLIEISELHAFRRADIQRIKGIISCATDRYRSSYGRRAADHPRQGVWAGSVNRDDWVEDDTGARRFWPISCGEMNLDYLRHARPQLFAEAVWRFKAGEPWWDISPLLAKVEQDKRRAADEWTDAVLQYCSGRIEITVSEILQHVLSLPLQERGRSEQMRVASIFRVAGFKKKDAWRNGRVVKIWLTIDPK